MNTYLPLRTHSYRISSTWTEFSWIYFAVLFDFFCAIPLGVLDIVLCNLQLWGWLSAKALSGYGRPLSVQLYE